MTSITLLDNGGQTLPFFNLALEEFLVRTGGTESLLLLYVNDPTVVLGKHQNPFQETDLSLLLGEEVTLSRRISGGGTVYHDRGNLNMALVTPYRMEWHNDYGYFLKPVIEFLSRQGIASSLNNRNSLLLEDGRKISGCAQFVSGERMMTHGTLLYDADLDRLERLLTPTEGILESRAVPSVRSRVANLAPLLPKFPTLDELAEGIAEAYCGPDPKRRSLTSEESRRVTEMVDERYSTWSWIFGRSPKFRVRVTSGEGAAFSLEVVDGIVVRSVGGGIEGDDSEDLAGLQIDELLTNRGFRMIGPGNHEATGEVE